MTRNAAASRRRYPWATFRGVAAGSAPPPRFRRTRHSASEGREPADARARLTDVTYSTRFEKGEHDCGSHNRAHVTNMSPQVTSNALRHPAAGRTVASCRSPPTSPPGVFLVLAAASSASARCSTSRSRLSSCGSTTPRRSRRPKASRRCRRPRPSSPRPGSRLQWMRMPAERRRGATAARSRSAAPNSPCASSTAPPAVLLGRVASARLLARRRRHASRLAGDHLPRSRQVARVRIHRRSCGAARPRHRA